jgi:hypothetical protein
MVLVGGVMVWKLRRKGRGRRLSGRYANLSPTGSRRSDELGLDETAYDSNVALELEEHEEEYGKDGEYGKDDGYVDNPVSRAS